MSTPILPLTIGFDLSAVFARFNQLEELIMATATEALTALAAKEDANHAALLDLFADVRALLIQLSQEQQLSDEARTLADALDAKLNADADEVHALDSQVGDADGSDATTPDPEPSPEPAPEAPVE